MPKYACRTDSNHGEIIRALRDAGVIVHDTSRLGGGFPDAIAQHRDGCIVLLEIKDGSLPPSARKLTPAEAEFHAVWPMTFVVTCPEEALAACGWVVS